MKEEILRLESVTLIKDGVTLLDNFNLHIFQGEIMGLLCLNDYGREALIELLCQNHPIHYGRVYFNEDLVNHYENSTMSRNKVTVIEKQSKLVEDLTVTDNIFVLRRGFKKYLINRNILNLQLQRFAKELDINIDGNELISNLTSYEKCVVELLKSIMVGTKLIVIKDVSNFISATDITKFQNLLKYYHEQGISFIYICNHHEEAFKICNRASLMENGKIVKVLDSKELSDEKIIPYIVDFSNIETSIQSSTKNANQGILRFQEVYTNNFDGMNFTIEKGECVVFLDVNNTVLTDMVKVMNGELIPISGDIFFNGELYLNKKSSSAIKKGVGFIDEQPMKSMIFKELSYMGNLCFLVDQKSTHIRLNKKVRRSILQEYEPLVGMDITAANVTTLSRTSLYSLIYYRLHLCNPKIVFCVQPFYNADMYLRRHIISLINKLKQKGITVIILAVNLEDSLIVADRLIVIEEGRFRNEYNRSEFHYFDQMSI